MIQDVITHAGIVLEGTLPQYLDGAWTHRHVQVTNNFGVESRDASEVKTSDLQCTWLSDYTPTSICVYILRV